MALRPNHQHHDIAATRRNSNQETDVLAEDIQANGEQTIIAAPCATCNAYQQERVLVYNSVIMDELVEPTSEETGQPLAAIVARDERITARTSAKPVPHAPSSKWGAAQVMQRAIDMRNQNLIPFSPFHAHIETDDLKAREIYQEWRDRYLGDLPATSRFAESPPPESGARQANGAERESSLLPDVEDTEGLELTGAAMDDPLLEEVPTSRDDLLKWVGSDRARAIAASEIEGRRSNGRRKTVDAVLIPLIGE